MFSDELYDTTDCPEIEKMILANARKSLEYEK
jgi:hypothetical protein